MAGAEKRVRGIDLLRGLCIIAVIFNHINLRIRLNQSEFGRWIGDAASSAIVWNGYYGVRVFFVISGFLITTWSLKRWATLSKLNVRQFYAMRFARIVPCLLGLLALLGVLDLAHAPRFTIATHVSLGRALLAALTFHINWLEGHSGYLPAAWDILWSLSVEEMFYVFFPILCAGIRNRWLLIALFSVFVVAAPFSRVRIQSEPWSDYAYLSCMDGIAIGCIAALIASEVKFGAMGRRVVAVTGIVLALVITVFRATPSRMGLYKVGLDVTVLSIGIALLVIALQQQFDQRARVTGGSVSAGGAKWGLRTLLGFPGAALRWFGRNSYEVYLTHMLVVWPMVGIFWRTDRSINQGPVWFLGTMILAGILGDLVARFYSEPLNRSLRRKLLSREPRGAAATASAHEPA